MARIANAFGIIAFGIVFGAMPVIVPMFAPKLQTLLSSVL